MSDQRELILARLVELARLDENVKTAARNRIDPPDTDLPGIFIFDGDETSVEDDPPARPTNAPRRVEMTPEIAIQVGDVPEDVGSNLNTLRAAYVKAVLTDATLIGIVLDRFGMRYLGCSTDFGRARSGEGVMWLHFRFTYALRPDQL